MPQHHTDALSKDLLTLRIVPTTRLLPRWERARARFSDCSGIKRLSRRSTTAPTANRSKLNQMGDGWLEAAGHVIDREQCLRSLTLEATIERHGGKAEDVTPEELITFLK